MPRKPIVSLTKPVNTPPSRGLIDLAKTPDPRRPAHPRNHPPSPRGQVATRVRRYTHALTPKTRTSPAHNTATVVPSHQQLTRWHITQIDTEPMTSEQHDLAVTALTTLITQWNNRHEKTQQAHAKVA